jgi:hypothetical protein
VILNFRPICFCERIPLFHASTTAVSIGKSFADLPHLAFAAVRPISERRAVDSFSALA